MSKQRQHVDVLTERLQRRDEFITQLAIFLVDNQAGKSIALQMPSGVIPWAREWATLRQKSFVNGYATVAEAERSIRDLLGLS